MHATLHDHHIAPTLPDDFTWKHSSTCMSKVATMACVLIFSSDSTMLWCCGCIPVTWLKIGCDMWQESVDMCLSGEFSILTRWQFHHWPLEIELWCY